MRILNVLRVSKKPFSTNVHNVEIKEIQRPLLLLLASHIAEKKNRMNSNYCVLMSGACHRKWHNVGIQGDTVNDHLKQQTDLCSLTIQTLCSAAETQSLRKRRYIAPDVYLQHLRQKGSHAGEEGLVFEFNSRFFF